MTTLASYSDLEGAIGRYLDRTDRATEIQEWVRLVEFEVGRKLNLRSQQLETSGTLSAGEDTLETPVGILYPENITFASDPSQTVDVVTFPVGEAFADANAGSAVPAQATVWGVTADYKTQIRLWPSVTGDLDYTLRYTTGITPLTAAAPTNYLLLIAADLYLYGALVHGHLFDENPEGAAVWRPLFDEQIRQVKKIEAWARAKAGRLRMRPRAQYALLG